MNILPFDKQMAAISALVDGCSIRATERLTGIHRDTIMRLGVRVGDGCATIHDRLMRGLRVSLIEVDEIWSFIGKKQKRLTPEDDAEKGDAYVFVALDATRKAILSYRVGKRDGAASNAFMADLRERVLGAPQISTDGFRPYGEAVELAFGTDCYHGAIVKLYHGEPGPDAARRYSPGMVVGVSKATISGSPRRERISTSYGADQHILRRAEQPGALQPVPRPRGAADHAGDGARGRGPHLDGRRAGRDGVGA